MQMKPCEKYHCNSKQQLIRVVLLDNSVLHHQLKNGLVSQLLFLADDTFFLEEMITIKRCCVASFRSIIF
jgi:hypothetical protein